MCKTGETSLRNDAVSAFKVCLCVCIWAFPATSMHSNAHQRNVRRIWQWRHKNNCQRGKCSDSSLLSVAIPSVPGAQLLMPRTFPLTKTFKISNCNNKKTYEIGTLCCFKVFGKSPLKIWSYEELGENKKKIKKGNDLEILLHPSSLSSCELLGNELRTSGFKRIGNSAWEYFWHLQF